MDTLTQHTYTIIKEINSMPQAAVLDVKVEKVKRRVLSFAANMSTTEVNNKVNELLDLRKKAMAIGDPTAEIDVEMSCWAEVWLRRQR